MFKKTKDSNVICDNIEKGSKNSDSYEFTIDGYVIDKNGQVSDFQVDGSTTSPMWKVRADGSTYDNLVLKNSQQSEGGQNLVDLTMKKIDEKTLASNWQWKTDDGSIETGHIEYILMTNVEIKEIRKIFNTCINP